MTGVWAAVSRDWKALIEPTSFSTLRLNQERLLQAGEIVTPVRKSYVRCGFPNRQRPSRPKAKFAAPSYRGVEDGPVHLLVPVVRSFAGWPSWRMRLVQRRLMPRTCCEIASRFPKLHTITWDLADGAHDHDFRVRMRHDFTAALSPSAPSEQLLALESLQHLNLWYGTSTSSFKMNRNDVNIEDYHHYVVDLNPQLCPEGTSDALSVVLAKLAMRMKTANLRGTIGQEFWSSLWPEGEEEDRVRRQLPPCPLRKLVVCVHTHTPQGIFHYRYDPNLEPERAGQDPPSNDEETGSGFHVEMDLGWKAAAFAAIERIPAAADIQVYLFQFIPKALLSPNGKGCGPFTTTTGHEEV
ncbi:hypothetical protein PG997_010991 [Apiospora hydei]|uniref:Uncharacterized protein n=1 Tax=Apiospora hydei TaxID=1337664 RepID=A0ABR1VLQ7_9PEZI